MVPQDHFLEKLDSLISFDFIRDITKSYYSYTGKPSIDPVVLVKMLLVGYLFDSIFSKARARFLQKKLFSKIFTEILKPSVSYGLVSGKGMLIDFTIVKANASLSSLV